jgi:hypothetical protein
MTILAIFKVHAKYVCYCDMRGRSTSISRQSRAAAIEAAAAVALIPSHASANY